ncbi:unnamed protein product [Rotaria magnacalcarata]
MTTAQRRVPGERQLLQGGENSYPVVRPRVAGRQQERGFAEVGPLGKVSHLLITEAVCPQYHRQRVALERYVAEYIQLFEIESRHASARNIQTTDHCRPGDKAIQRAQYIGEVSDAHQVARLVEADQVANPGEGGDVGDAVLVAHDPGTAQQAFFQHPEQAPGFGGIAVAGALVFVGLAGEFIEEAQLAEHRANARHLEHQPLNRFITCRRIFGEQLAGFFRQVDQDRAGLEHTNRLGAAVVHQRGDLRVRVDCDKTAAELVAVADLDQPGVVFRAGMPEGQQLFEEDGDLLPVGRGQGIQLQRVLADRQFLFMGRAGNRAVDAGEGAAAFGVPGPDFRRYVIGHAECSRGACA